MNRVILVYGLKNCDRCRAALKWLKAHGLKVSFHDVRQDGFPEKSAQGWIAALGAEQVINRRSTTWRQLPTNLRASKITPAEALALMKEYPALLKRPVMEFGDGYGDKFLIGFNDAVKSELGRALKLKL